MNTAGVSEPPGLWLRGQRIAAGLTQEDLAERSGVSVRTIADMERGRTRQAVPEFGAGADPRARAAGRDGNGAGRAIPGAW